MDQQNQNQPQKEEQSQREQKGERGEQPPFQLKGFIAWVLILSATAFMLHTVIKGSDDYIVYPYAPDFAGWLENNQIKECDIIQQVSGVTFVKGETHPIPDKDGSSKAVKFKVFIPNADREFMDLLHKHGVTNVKLPPQNPMMWQILSNILPIVLIFGLLYFIFMRQVRSVGHGAMSFGKSRARMLNRDRKKVTFKDVAGIDEAKEEVQEIIEFLKDPKKFQKLGGRIPKGVMLMGPPGTGKTLLAKAIAGEADVPFFSISGSDFVEMFVGVGASRVRDMFEQGKRNAPCIIFIDEIDAVGRSRFTGIGGGHDEREQTLNALLVEMDGFDTQEGVIILAATNRPDVLDQALMRPGRFDRQIVIDLPMIDGREAILKIHSRNIKLAGSADLRKLARGTPGFSGADMENLLNEAALLAARKNKSGVEMEDMEEARDKVKWGRERRSRVLDDKEKKITAYHEAGHAIVMQLVEESEPLHKITIIPRGVAYLGATMQLPEKDRYMEGKIKLMGMITGLMAGRVTEEIIFKDVTSGAASDLREATRIARLMVCNWGMNEDLGPQSFGENEELMFLGREVSRSQNYSEETSRKIDAEIHNILSGCYNRARKIITKNMDKLEKLVALLLERETLDGRDVEEIVRHGRILNEEERAEADRQKEEAGKDNPTAGDTAGTGKNDGTEKK